MSWRGGDDVFDVEDVLNRVPTDFFESLIGGTYDFYGVDNDAFCIGVGGARMVLEAVEDPDDGYRSYFGCFKTTEVEKIFFGSPIARVVLERGGLSSRTYCWCEGYDHDTMCPDHVAAASSNFSGWVLRDAVNGHVWLTVGTDNGEDYYPCFTFRYTPDRRNSEKKS